MSLSAGDKMILTGAAAGTTPGVMATINEYLPLVMAAISLIGLIAGFYFKWQERKDRNKVLAMSHDALREELRQQLLEEIKSEEGDQNDKVSCN